MNWIHYLAEANLYVVAFYVLYVLLLRSETHYQLNRAYLLISNALAFAIPLMQLGILKPVVQTTANISIGEMGNVTTMIIPSTVVAEASKWTMQDYILLGYGIVAFIMFVNLCIRIYLLMALSKKGSVQKGDGFNLIELHQGSVAFSFFNNLFIDDRLASSQTVLHHEQVHIKQKHSWDIIYLEVLKIINWFNPIIYLVIAAIKELHEFIADEQTVGLEKNHDAYTDFLISNAYGITQNPLTNSFFNKNLLKRRITMLYQQRSGKAARLKYLLALPLICGLLCISTLAFTTKTYGWVDLAPHVAIQSTNDQQQLQNTGNIPFTEDRVSTQISDGSSKNKEQDQNITPAHTVKSTASDIEDTTKVHTSAEKNPEFPGGEVGFTQFLNQNIHYPADDKKNSLQGRVFAQFIVEKDGSLSDIKILRTPSGAMGEEAVRVLKLSPKWKPGMEKGAPLRIQYTVPINFSLADPPPPNVDPYGPNAVYTAVELNPEFPGGEAGFRKFLQQNIRYPKEDREKGTQGKVYIQFIVEKDGSLSNMKVLRTPSTAMSEESVRVLSLSPKWKPGTQNGQPVRVQYTVPVSFSLGDDGPKDINALYKFMQRNIRYPTESRNNKTTGRVYIQFTLDANKQIQNLKVVRTPDAALGNEVMRVLQSYKTLSDGDPAFTYTACVFFGLNGVEDNTPSVSADPSKAQSTNNNKMLNMVVVMGY